MFERPATPVFEAERTSSTSTGQVAPPEGSHGEVTHFICGIADEATRLRMSHVEMVEALRARRSRL